MPPLTPAATDARIAPALLEAYPDLDDAKRDIIAHDEGPLLVMFNAFETAFGEFLDRCEDVGRFAALAETYTGFWVDYVKPSGATGRYFPDWVVVQELEGGDANWIVETKGRVWEGTDRKDAAIRYWCEQITALIGESWRYIRVDQPIFRPESLGSFAELVSLIEQRAPVIDEQLIVVPEDRPMA